MSIDRLTLQLIVRCENEAGAERIAEKLIRHGREQVNPICGVVCACGPNLEPLACGYEQGHAGAHAWATLPTFPERCRFVTAASMRCVLSADDPHTNGHDIGLGM